MANESRMLIDALRYGLVVSCRAHGDHPLRDSALITALARCAQKGGAAAIRADGREDIGRINQEVELPVIGIRKVALTA